MKNKSFLFLIAALAMGLAFASCGGDDTGGGSYPVPGPANGYAGPIADINEAFYAGASTVYLTKDTEFSASDEAVLVIPKGKKLDLRVFKLTDSAVGYIVNNGTIVWDDDNETPITLGQSYIVADTDFISGKVGTASSEAKPVTVKAGSAVAIDGGVAGAIFATTNDLGTAELGALAAGSYGFLLKNPASLSSPVTNSAGYLYIAGDVNLSSSGTFGAGTLIVGGKLTSSIADSPSVVLAAGSVTARSLDVKGGVFGGTVTLTDRAASSVLSGTLTKFAGGLTTEGGLTISHAVEFGAEADIGGLVNGKITVDNDNAKIIGLLTGTNAAIGKKLTVAGTLAVEGAVDLGSGGSIVFDQNGGLQLHDNGKLVTSAYSLTGAGSILANAGTDVTLGVSGITADDELAGGTPTLVFSDSILLDFLKDATIADLALDVQGGGTIGIPASGFLTITGAGSLVTGTDAGSIAHADHSGSKAVIAAVSGGSLVAGSIGLSGDALVAGSLGTISTGVPGQIVVDNSFAIVNGYDITATGNLEAIAGGDNAASEAGSIGVFEMAK
ncbi:MAG: hypothetical protein LBJ86_01505 [Spirochaetaceae bacterium]|jgi:hypothetical protein|nr:hypothetical protein [Spirochaetaceae bacterium]